MKKVASLLIFIVIIIALAVFLSPYYKLYTFKNAHEQGDYAPIINSIDFDTLRPNLKQQLHTKMDSTIANNELTQALALFGVNPAQIQNFAIRFGDQAIDKSITADNFHALAKGDVNDDTQALLVGVAVLGGFVDLGKLVGDYLATGNIEQAINNQKNDIKQKAKALSPAKPTTRYCGFNCFAIDTQIKNQPISVMMTRHNLVDWQIDNVVVH